jgi:hypothetical protein
MLGLSEASLVRHWILRPPEVEHRKSLVFVQVSVAAAANMSINTGSKKRRSFVALLYAAGYGQR